MEAKTGHGSDTKCCCTRSTAVWYTIQSSALAPQTSQPVLPFQPKYSLGHPEKYLFLLSTNVFSGPKYPKNKLINFETNFTDYSDSHTPHTCRYTYNRTPKHRIVLGEKTSVYKRHSGLQIIRLWSKRHFERAVEFQQIIASLVIFVLMLSTNCEIKIRIVVIQYQRNLITTGSTINVLN